MPFSMSLKKIAIVVCAVAVCLVYTKDACADEAAITDREAVEFFERRVRPVLVEHCVKCHGPKKQESGLRLDSREAILKGGDSGPAARSAKPKESLLVKAVRRTGDLKMPPDTPLKPDQVEAISRWVMLGLPWPKSTTSPIAGADDRTSHWAFQTVVKPEPPGVKDKAWPITDVDQFVLSRLEAKQLQPAPRAEPVMLIRRATFDLIGLPPTPEEVLAFEEAYEKDADAAWRELIDRLLDSPHYGERQGRYWLDVARYADNKGYVFFEQKKFPWAWTYRDWVVRAFNEDLSFDRFVKLQLAADQMKADPADLAAMGFLTLGPRFSNNTHDILDDRIDVVTRGLLGLTVTCARCHDHKFDPIPQADYYSLYGVFRSSREPTLRPLLTAAPDTDQYREFSKGMQERIGKLESFIKTQRDGMMLGARKRAAEYLIAAHKKRNHPTTENFMLLTDKGAIIPAMLRRWEAYLKKARRRKDPVWVVWFRFSDLPDAEFAERAKVVHAELLHTVPSPPAGGEGGRRPDAGWAAGAPPPPPPPQQTSRPPAADRDSPSPALRAPSPPRGEGTNLNPLVAAAFSEPPKLMDDVAKIYGDLLAKIELDWRKQLERGDVAVTRLEDDSAEALRQVLYGRGSPPMVPQEFGWGFLDLLPDRPTQGEFKKLLGEVEKFSTSGAGAPPRAMVLVDSVPYEPMIFQRGNSNREGEAVPRRFLKLLSPADRIPFATGSGRLDLARAIVDPKNPLTARVLVNRIWQQHFGTGLVETASDFGLRSASPSHPELLDWLASEFVASGWSVKQLHWVIMTSAVYRQSSVAAVTATQKSELADSSNRLLWKFPRRRLGFEVMRDAHLAVSGSLDRRLGGAPANVLSGYNGRRTIYGFVDRMDLPGLMRTFDFPEPAATSPGRESTTVPQQALFFLNHSFVSETAARILRRADVSGLKDPTVRLDRLHRILFGRSPSDDELALAGQFLNRPDEETTSPTAWKYGYGRVDEKSKRVSKFAELTHWTGSRWQAGPTLPDGKLGWVFHDQTGGHPASADDRCFVLRWTAPVSGEFEISGKLAHRPEPGNGVRGRIVSSEHGILGEWKVDQSEADTPVAMVAVKAGETIDFVVDWQGHITHDEFEWPVVISQLSPDRRKAQWDSKRDFAAGSSDPWTDYVHALLMTNEFVFLE
jgi:hypothetical protein